MALQTEQGETSNLDDSGFIEPESFNSENASPSLLEQEKFGNCVDIESEQGVDEDGHVDNEEITNNECEGERATDGDYQANEATPCERCAVRKERCRKLKRELKELQAVVREYERRDKKFAVPLDCSVCIYS